MSAFFHARNQVTAALLWALLPVACVKQSDYEALQKENQALQARIDQMSLQLQQSQADLVAAQTQVLQFQASQTLTQTQFQTAKQQLEQSEAALSALKAEFDKFRTQRRNAMVGKKYPVLNLDDGKVLRDAQIASINGEEVSFRHDGGFMRVALANTTDDLRWEACYNLKDEQQAANERRVAEARQLERLKSVPQKKAGVTKPAVNVVTVLQQQLAAQRQQLNREFQALAAKNPGALSGPIWDSARPEASPLLNTVSGSRAVLGISRLQSLRDVILSTLQQLRDIDPASR